MYARILLVGSDSCGEASVLARLRAAMQDDGHATAAVHPGPGGKVDAEELEAFLRAFRPSLVIWDLSSAPWECNVHCSDIARASSVYFACINASSSMSGTASGKTASGFDLLDLPPFRDDRYLSATTSSPVDADRAGSILVFQERTGRRENVLQALRQDGGRIVSWHPSWKDGFKDPALSAGAFSARHCSACACFDGPDAPSPQEAILRMHEGCALVVEESLADRWESAGLHGLACACAKAPAQDMARACARLAWQESARDEALRRQEFFVRSLPSASDAVESLVSQAESNGARALVQDAPAKKIVLYGWFGKRNFGDDLLLSTAAGHFQKRFPEAVVNVVGGDAQRVRSEFGFEAATPDQRYLVRSFLQGSSLLAFFGGLIFDDPTELTAGDIETFMDPWIDPAGQAAVCLTAWLYGVPQIYLCAGMGPLSKPAARHAARLIGLSGIRFLLRDENSAELAREAGVPSESISVAADLIMSAGRLVEDSARAPLPDSVPDGPYVTVALRDWPLNPPDFAENVASALDRTVEETGFAVLFVPFDAEDVGIHRAVFSRMRCKDKAVCLEARPEPSQILGIVARSKMALAMRLHCSILHHASGKPAVGLDYNDKIAAHFESMHQTGSLLALDAEPRSIARALTAIAADYDGACEDVRSNAAELAKLANDAMEEAFRTIQGHTAMPDEPLVFHPRGVSKSRLDLAQLGAEVDRLAEERARLEERCREAEKRAADLESSWSYRVGHAIMRLPHRIKSWFR